MLLREGRIGNMYEYEMDISAGIGYYCDVNGRLVYRYITTVSVAAFLLLDLMPIHNMPMPDYAKVLLSNGDTGYIWHRTKVRKLAG